MNKGELLILALDAYSVIEDYSKVIEDKYSSESLPGYLQDAVDTTDKYRKEIRILVEENPKHDLLKNHSHYLSLFGGKTSKNCFALYNFARYDTDVTSSEYIKEFIDNQLRT